MRPSFNFDDYNTGQSALRSALVAGLSRLPPDHHAGSFTIGAFCAVVRLIWDRRDPGAGRDKIAAYLGTITSDILREAEGRVEPPSPLQSMIEGLESAAICCAPRNDQGRVIKDRELVLTALAALASDIIAEEPDPDLRTRAIARHSNLVAEVVRASAAEPASQPFNLQVVTGGRA